MIRAYIEMKARGKTRHSRVMRLDEVYVVVTKTLNGDAQYYVMGHDQLTGGWYPVTEVWRALEPAWEACEEMHRKITAQAMEQWKGERRGATV